MKNLESSCSIGFLGGIGSIDAIAIPGHKIEEDPENEEIRITLGAVQIVYSRALYEENPQEYLLSLFNQEESYLDALKVEYEGERSNFNRELGICRKVLPRCFLNGLVSVSSKFLKTLSDDNKRRITQVFSRVKEFHYRHFSAPQQQSHAMAHKAKEAEHLYDELIPAYLLGGLASISGSGILEGLSDLFKKITDTADEIIRIYNLKEELDSMYVVERWRQMFPIVSGTHQPHQQIYTRQASLL